MREIYLKTILRILLAAIVMTIGIVPANAAESGIIAADVTVQEAEVVYVPVSLQEEIAATAMSLVYTYDSRMLEVIPEKCSWIPKGALEDFSKTAPQAVWAASGAKKLSGDICVLAFRVLDTKEFQETEVTCSVTAKNDSGTIGVYEDSAGITKICAHRFGDWTDGGASGHIRKCSVCGKEELQSHAWNNGTASADPEKLHITVMTYQCTVCSAEKTTEVPGGNQTGHSGHPEGTKPSEPVEFFPEETRPQPSYPAEEENRKTGNETNKPDSGKPVSQESSRPGENPENAGRGQNDGGQPRDYNQTSDANVLNPSNGTESLPGAQEAYSAENGNIAGSFRGSAPMTETHPMAIKLEETAAVPGENAAAQTAENNQKTKTLLLAAGAGVAVLAAAALWILVIRKRKP